MKKNVSNKGKISLRRFLQTFEVGDKVRLGAEPAYQNGMYHPRFYGKVGTVAGNNGKCYEVAIKDFTKAKTVVVHPVHLVKC